MKTLTINDELKNLLPSLSAEEFADHEEQRAIESTQEYREPRIILDEVCGTIRVHKDVPPESFAEWFVENFSLEYLQFFSDSLIDELYVRYRDDFAGKVITDIGKQSLSWTPEDRKQAIMLAIEHWPEKSNREIAELVDCSRSTVQRHRSAINANR